MYQVIFSNGEGALQVLPRLLDIIPEARLNLVSPEYFTRLFLYTILLCIYIGDILFETRYSLPV